jgi:hypothetical protein
MLEVIANLIAPILVMFAVAIVFTAVFTIAGLLAKFIRMAND